MAPAAILVVLDAGELEGEFSDNLLTLEPCGASARRVCFSAMDAQQQQRRPESAAADDDGAGRKRSRRSGDEDAREEAPAGDDRGPRSDLLDYLRGNLTAVALNSQGGLWWSSGE